MGLLSLCRAANTHFCPGPMPELLKCHVFCMSLVTGLHHAASTKGITPSWAQLSLTWGCGELVALGRGKGRWAAVVLEWKIVGANGREVPEGSRSSVAGVQGYWCCVCRRLCSAHGVILAARQMFPGFSWQHGVLQRRASCVL